MRVSWRDCKEWQDEGLKFSTTSDNACKLYDAALTQFVGWYDEPTVGGLEKTCADLFAADPKFVMGQVMNIGLTLIGTGRTTRLDQVFQQSLDILALLAKSTDITDREKMHVSAIQSFADGDLPKACSTWEDILLEHPYDLLALKFAHDGYFYVGKAVEMRDSIARVLPQWKPSIPLYNYLHGMFAFSLEETNRYPEAVKHAKLGLELNRNDGWATHALVHVYEMTSRNDRGIEVMRETENNWNVCGALATHNYWHLALFYVDRGEHESALSLFDAKIAEKYKSGALLDLVDIISLLYRLELEGVDVGNRWKEVANVCEPHINDHITCFNDAHYAMALQRNGNTDLVDQLMSSMGEFMNSHPDYYMAQVAKRVGYSVCEALIAHNSGDYQKVVELLYPIRYRIVEIGGSHAQRDLFELILIHSALKSPVKKHQKIAKLMLLERKCVRGNSSMTERLIERTLACH